MNKRVKELMKQAGTDTSGKWMGIENAEKFAELIIRECIEIVEYKGRKVGTKHPVGFNLMDAAIDIKEHLGIVE